MSIFTAIPLPTSNIGTQFNLQIPVNKRYLGIEYLGQNPYLFVENISNVDPGATEIRILNWIPASTTLPTGWDEMYPAFFSGNPYLLMIQGIR